MHSTFDIARGPVALALGHPVGQPLQLAFRRDGNGPRPVGRLHVVRMQRHKEWIVPESIQEEMRREGKDVLTRVPPGPDNPLGRHWIGLSIGGIGIHGTIASSGVYHFRSHGCIRLHPEVVSGIISRR